MSDALIGDDGIFHYSYSTLSDQARCPARNYFKKLARAGKIVTDVNLHAIFGSAIHKGIEDRLKSEKNPFDSAKEYLAEELEKLEYSEYNSKEYTDKCTTLNNCLNNFEVNFYPSLSKVITDPQSQVELRLETPFRKGVLVGKIDVALPETWADWKSGKVSALNEIALNPQHGFYWYLAQKTGLEPPKEFVYVYLQGQNQAKKVASTGRVIADRDNKLMKYSFPVYPTEESVMNLLNNFIVPLAKSYEEGIIYKNQSVWNCGSCQYRTACKDYSLPTIEE